MDQNFSVWDYVVFLAMLLVSATVGMYYAWKEKGKQTDAEFLLAGRQMSGIPVSLSLTASFMSAVTVLGTPAEVYRFGAMFSLFFISYTLVIVLTSEIYMPVFYRLRISSTYEYLELRFNKQIRFLGTMFFITQTILYTGIVIYAPALALNQVTGFELWGAVVATGLVCTFYCTLGGLKAVVWTDVIQAVVMVAGFCSIIFQALKIQGGLKTILKHAQEGGRLKMWDFNPNPLQRHTFWTITIGGTFTWISIYGVNQSQVQRYLACKNKFHAKLALYLNLVGLWIILICAVLSGLSLYSVYRHCDPWTSQKVKAPDQLMPYLAMHILHDYPGLPGLFVSCAYSGTLSTVSTSITALATVAVEDLIKPQLDSPSPKTLSLLSQGTSVFFGILCIGMAALASLMGGLLQAALSIFGMVGGPLLGLFSLGILNPYANSKGSFVGLMFGFCFSIWIGVGTYIYPPPPSRTLPLPLSTANCTQSRSMPLNLTSLAGYSVLIPWKSTAERSFLMNTVYSLSYLYLSCLGTMVTVIMGTIVSLLTGGKNQIVNSNYLLKKSDLTLGKLFSRNRAAAASPS
ncbi:sodium-coupled monocarboxylate transporter 1-like [Trichosurus vulpecula]|uniref:sodium-coupled monocarboxylate transporter 1-like n=1 Tax=Trichosurus vulpecula TaxID=9337 RepID=UPI00186B0141|nr:sodium-coupled monocarboxylate transporter 1-like [Trichosurus vulpecula]